MSAMPLNVCLVNNANSRFWIDDTRRDLFNNEFFGVVVGGNDGRSHF